MGPASKKIKGEEAPPTRQALAPPVRVGSPGGSVPVPPARWPPLSIDPRATRAPNSEQQVPSTLDAADGGHPCARSDGRPPPHSPTQAPAARREACGARRETCGARRKVSPAGLSALRPAAPSCSVLSAPRAARAAGGTLQSPKYVRPPPPTQARRVRAGRGCVHIRAPRLARTAAHHRAHSSSPPCPCSGHPPTPRRQNLGPPLARRGGRTHPRRARLARRTPSGPRAIKRSFTHLKYFALPSGDARGTTVDIPAGSVRAGREPATTLTQAPGGPDVTASASARQAAFALAMPFVAHRR